MPRLRRLYLPNVYKSYMSSINSRVQMEGRPRGASLSVVLMVVNQRLTPPGLEPPHLVDSTFRDSIEPDTLRAVSRAGWHCQIHGESACSRDTASSLRFGRI